MQIAPGEVLSERLVRLHSAFASHAIDALLVTSLPNIAYLTGFFASAAALVVTRERLYLIGDGRYESPLIQRAQAWSAIEPVLLPTGGSYDEQIVSVLTPLRGLRVGFESSHLTVRRHRYLSDRLASAGWTDMLIDADGAVEDLRLRKDEWERARIRDGAARLSSVAKCILPKALAGRREWELAGEIDAELRRAGFERPAFDTIVASGANAALPHSRPTDRVIEPGDLVVLDFGGVLDGYCTDLTRTVAVAPVGSRERQLIEQVSEAQAAAFAAIAVGGEPEGVDLAARAALERYGLAEAFPHGTGHGLGLEVHEAPRIAKRRAGPVQAPLAAGMVMTLEPGVYFSGWGGVRIEDDVLVTEGGGEWLTDVPRTQ